ncbi:Yae1 N terminal domain containing protein-like protein [Leptotrombidium deliense]|uniref:Yae1 N terminal domain containing protein-like protein n=1 Tax=Leptotrombidium deliense TaxID=299467 RepID=A0A443SFV5_9ACAR|nr:Yae1 N terminal domain containing protein-like protein [Leptotrombidium deliense]
MGFTRGYSLGEEAGWRDGYAYGVRKGAQIAAEIGFYQGFVHAWITILEKEESTKQRKLTALKTLLEMTRNFPKTNIHEEDTLQRLSRIRAKFKQVNALLNCGDSSFSFGSSSFCGSMDRNDVYPPNPTPSSSVPGASGISSAKCSPAGTQATCNEMSF